MTFLICHFISFGQGTKLKFNKDTASANALLKLAKQYHSEGNSDSCINNADKALVLSEAAGYQEGIADALLIKGNASSQLRSDPVTARTFFTRAKEIAEKINYTKTLVRSISGIAWTYQNEGNNTAALEHFLRALKIAESTGDKKLIAKAHHNLGVNYVYRGDVKTGIKEYFEALKVFEELKDTSALITSYFVIGIAYSATSELQDLELSTDYQLKRIKLLEAIHDTISVAYGYNELAQIYGTRHDYKTSLQYCYKALDILKHTQELEGIENTYQKITANLINDKQYEKVLHNAFAGLEITYKTNGLRHRADFYQYISTYYNLLGDYKNAYNYFLLSSATKDSIIKKESAKQIAEMQTKYETVKKEQQIMVLNTEKEKEAAMASEKNRRQQLIIGSVVGGLLLVIVFAGLIFRSLQITRKQKKIIELKNKETEEQKLMIEEKQKEILDSIQYARRIQQSLLPTEKYIDKNFKRLWKK